MRKLTLAFSAALLLAASSPGQSTDLGAAAVGTWKTAGGKGVIRIFEDRNKLCGLVVSLKDPTWPANDPGGMGGKPKTDRRNPDPSLRQRPIVGLQIMESFAYVGRNKWQGGRIYDPESGKTYKCRMTLVDTNRLEVRGYVGFSLLGRTEEWRRVQ